MRELPCVACCPIRTQSFTLDPGNIGELVRWYVCSWQRIMDRMHAKTESKLVIDGRHAAMTKGTGIATYARSVVSAASALGLETHMLFGKHIARSADPLLREIQFFGHREPDSSLASRAKALLRCLTGNALGLRPEQIVLSDNVEKGPIASSMIPADHYWNAPGLFTTAEILNRSYGGFANVSNTIGAAVAHWTYPAPARLRNAKNIYTLHDTVPLRLPYTTTDNKKAYYRLIKRICREADLVVTVSEQSKNDIVALCPEVEDRIVNTYQSVEIPDALRERDPQKLANQLRGLYDLEAGEYILYFGAVEPKKNVGRLIEAYLAAGLDIPLVIAGKDGWLIENETLLINRPRPKRHQIDTTSMREQVQIRRIEYLSLPDLINLIEGARLVAFPSIYEGFGLPIVEAMACGTPVLTSQTGSMAEIAGDAALLVDPLDVRSIRDGIIKLNGDPGFRKTLVQRGQKRAAVFSLEAHAKRLGEAYRQAGLVIAPTHDGDER